MSRGCICAGSNAFVRGLMVGVGLTLAVASVPAAAQAQSFPSKPMRIILPYPGGTGPEIIARLFGGKFREAWGQPVVIESRPGASGFLAMEAIRKGSTDGHDLLIADTAQLALLRLMHRQAMTDKKSGGTCSAT